MSALPKMKIKSFGKFIKFMMVLLKMSSLLGIKEPPEDEQLCLLLTKLYFYLLSSGISQLNKMGHPAIREWTSRARTGCTSGLWRVTRSAPLTCALRQASPVPAVESISAPSRSSA